MRRLYIHQLSGWPEIHWDPERIANLLAHVRHEQGRLVGRVEGLGFSLRLEAELKTLTLDVLKSSEIEGEILDARQVRSSVARRLGLDIGGLEPVDRHVEGLVEMRPGAIKSLCPRKGFSTGMPRCFRWVEGECLRLPSAPGERTSLVLCRSFPGRLARKEFISKPRPLRV